MENQEALRIIFFSIASICNQNVFLIKYDNHTEPPKKRSLFQSLQIKRLMFFVWNWPL
jgi:hypothetical protein